MRPDVAGDVDEMRPTPMVVEGLDHPLLQVVFGGHGQQLAIGVEQKLGAAYVALQQNIAASEQVPQGEGLEGNDSVWAPGVLVGLGGHGCDDS